MTWGSVMRFLGSLHSMCDMRSFRWLDTTGLLGKLMGCVRMTLYRPMMLGCLKGTVPATRHAKAPVNDEPAYAE